MIIEFLVLMMAWIGLSTIIKFSFGIPFILAFPFTLACIFIYDFIMHGVQGEDSKGR